MSLRTRFFNLSKIGKGDSLADDGYKPMGADRDLIDLLFQFYGPNHHHTGALSSAPAPSLPLSLTLDQSAGSLPAGATFFYKYSLVDAAGNESIASPEAFILTPAPIADPGSPTLAVATTGGTLLPGAYNYVLSAYKTANTFESRATGFQPINILGPSTTNKVTLTLPSLPSGAHGFNVYRRKPGGTGYQWIAAVAMNVTTPPTVFVDTGLPDDCARSLPNANRTNSQNSVRVALPGATPVVPIGSTWKVYRTRVTSDYHNSLLHWVVEETSEGSGIITPLYQDLGYATTLGEPPAQGRILTQPQPIVLTDAGEVTGVLPPKNIVFRHIEEFFVAGTLATNAGVGRAWRCPFEVAYIIEVMLNLGRSYSPQVSDVIVDINKYDSALATPAWATIFTDQAERPRVLVGQFIGTTKVPAVRKLVRGDLLQYELDQVGGGATRTDKDLSIQVVMYVKDTTATTIVFP